MTGVGCSAQVAYEEDVRALERGPSSIACGNAKPWKSARAISKQQSMEPPVTEG